MLETHSLNLKKCSRMMCEGEGVEESPKKSGRFVQEAFGEQVFLTTLAPFLLDYSRFFSSNKRISSL